MTADHLIPTRGSRGFAYMPAIGGQYGSRIQAYESSSADEPAVWVQLDGAQILLSAEDAWKLSEQLKTLVQNHYQGDATPEWAKDRS